jgi:hypothetical protein
MLLKSARSLQFPGRDPHPTQESLGLHVHHHPQWPQISQRDHSNKNNYSQNKNTNHLLILWFLCFPFSFCLFIPGDMPLQRFALKSSREKDKFIWLSSFLSPVSSMASKQPPLSPNPNDCLEFHLDEGGGEQEHHDVTAATAATATASTAATTAAPPASTTMTTTIFLDKSNVTRNDAVINHPWRQHLEGQKLWMELQGEKRRTIPIEEAVGLILQFESPSKKAEEEPGSLLHGLSKSSAQGKHWTRTPFHRRRLLYKVQIGKYCAVTAEEVVKNVNGQHCSQSSRDSLSSSNHHHHGTTTTATKQDTFKTPKGPSKNKTVASADKCDRGGTSSAAMDIN